jgi:hypothetical protein
MKEVKNSIGIGKKQSYKAKRRFGMAIKDK